MFRSGPRLAVALLSAVAALLLVCWSIPSAAQPPTIKASHNRATLTVAYSSEYVFLTPKLAAQWWNTVAKDFEAQYPNVTLKLIPIPGTYTDVVTKMSLLYRESATAPDIAELPSADLGDWVSSGYLLSLNKYLAKSSWWKSFPKSVQGETEINGTYYAVNHGENTNALWYNTTIFKKAHISLPWKPKTWADVLAAAEKIHAALPKVVPMWAAGGNAIGTIGIENNAGNFLTGSTNSTIFDTKTGKWVVDSPGLRQTLQFYKTLGEKGLAAPTSELLNPNAVDDVPGLLAAGNIGIAIGVNFYGESWVKSTCGPCWAQAPRVMAMTPLPTIYGQGSDIASVLGGWDLAISAHTQNAALAWDFVNIAQNTKNMIDASNWAGWIPPSTVADANPLYLNYAPPFQAEFAKLLPVSQEEPNTADFVVWGTAFNEATGQLISNPATSIDQAIGTMKTYVSQQLGSNMVETIP